MKRVADELRRLADDLCRRGDLENGEALFHAFEDFSACPCSRVAADGEEESEFVKAHKLLDEKLTQFPKKHGWWDPPRNMAINSALMGFNLWVFNLLPMFPEKRAYKAKSDRLPEGLVIDPGWVPAPNSLGGNRLFGHTVEAVEFLIKLPSKVKSVVDSSEYQLKWVETHFKVQIPSELMSKLLQDVLKIAPRRWGVDRLRSKRILLPFDGSKSVQLGSFD
jgi:hypothetical protein